LRATLIIALEQTIIAAPWRGASTGHFAIARIAADAGSTRTPSSSSSGLTCHSSPERLYSPMMLMS
jgi:hypothetical protein